MDVVTRDYYSYLAHNNTESMLPEAQIAVIGTIQLLFSGKLYAGAIRESEC